MYPTYETMTREQWRKTIRHDHANPSRALAFREIWRLLDRDTTLELAEIGFCNGWDFRCQFRAWHDAGLVSYAGYDTYPQFVDYAQAEWPGYLFCHGSAQDMWYCDISYARHVFMTMEPELMEPELLALLSRTRVLSIVTWHYPPQYDSEHFKHHKKGERDVWTNRYERAQVERLYDIAGFDVRRVSADGESIYVAKRRPPSVEDNEEGDDNRPPATHSHP